MWPAASLPPELAPLLEELPTVYDDEHVRILENQERRRVPLPTPLLAMAAADSASGRASPGFP